MCGNSRGDRSRTPASASRSRAFDGGCGRPSGARRRRGLRAGVHARRRRRHVHRACRDHVRTERCAGRPDRGLCGRRARQRRGQWRCGRCPLQRLLPDATRKFPANRVQRGRHRVLASLQRRRQRPVSVPGSGRWPRLSLHELRTVQCQPVVPGLRPTGPEGHFRNARYSAGGLGGHLGRRRVGYCQPRQRHQKDLDVSAIGPYQHLYLRIARWPLSTLGVDGWRHPPAALRPGLCR